MGYITSVEPSIEVITTDEAKDFLKVLGTTEDDLIGNIIKSMRLLAERYLQQALITQTIEEKIDAWPVSGVLRPTLGPVQSVASIQYIDTDGALQTWAAANYVVDTHSKYARITPAYGETFPSARAQINAITLTYVAGYGAAVTDVPETIRQAILKAVADGYDNREDYVKRLPTASTYMLDSFIYQLG